MKEVGAGAFQECRQLKSVLLNEGLKKLGAKEVVGESECEGKVFAYSAVESVRLPSTLKRIEAWTFNCCNRLKSVEIPRGVESFGECCFRDRKISEITLPCTLREIGRDAFKNCKNLKTVWVERGCQVEVEQHVDKGVEVRYK